MEVHELPADLAAFVRQELRSGKYTSEDEIVCAALRLLRERERRLDALRDEILPAPWTDSTEEGVRPTMRLGYGRWQTMSKAEIKRVRLV